MEEINVKELISIFWKRKSIIIVITLLFILIGVVRGTLLNQDERESNVEELYCAEASFIVGVTENLKPYKDIEEVSNDLSIFFTSSPYGRIKIDDNMFATYEDLIKIDSSILNVLEKLNIEEDVENIKNNIFLSRSENSNVITIRFYYNNESLILDITNSLVDEFEKTIKKVYVVDQMTVLDEAHLMLKEDAQINGINDFDTQKNRPIKNIVIFAFLGLILSATAIIVLEMFDDTIREDSIIDKDYNINILTKINSKIDDKQDAFAMVLPNLSKMKSILITSPEEDENNLLVAKNLSKSFAKINKKVLLIKILSTRNDSKHILSEKDIEDYINNKDKKLDKFITKEEEIVDSISIIEENNKYFDETKISNFINQLEENYEMILIEANNILQNTNTLIITKNVSGTIIVVKERKTKIDKFNDAQKAIENVNGKIIGTINII